MYHYKQNTVHILNHCDFKLLKSYQLRMQLVLWFDFVPHFYTKIDQLLGDKNAMHKNHSNVSVLFVKRLAFCSQSFSLHLLHMLYLQVQDSDYGYRSSLHLYQCRVMRFCECYRRSRMHNPSATGSMLKYMIGYNKSYLEHIVGMPSQYVAIYFVVKYFWAILIIYIYTIP